ncbi:MAG: hypothetical protein ABIH76_00780 [Candidatus Bathyarchaeota archaeon]
MKKLRTKFITDPVFRENFWFCVGDIDEFIKFVKTKCDYEVEKINSDGKTVIAFDENADEFHFLWLEKNNPSVLIHELSHICFESLVGSGINHTIETDEVYAYYLAWMYEECNNFLNAKKKENTRKVKKRSSKISK